MIYAKRDNDGRITALFDTPGDDGLETVTTQDPEVLDFLHHSQDGDAPLAFLQHSDLELIRVVEDLVELLVDKHLIMFTELPAAAQQKLMGRKRARASLSDTSSLMVDKDDIL